MASDSKYGISPYSFIRPSFEALDRPSDRIEYEKQHKTGLDYSFNNPLVMTPKALNHRLSLARLHQSCNKACALYCIPNIPYLGPLGSNARNNIFSTVYNKWHIPYECNIFYNAFATQLIGCWDNDSPKDVDRILALHAELCRQVERRQKVLDETDALEPISADVRFHGNFALAPLFRAVVIIIDKEDWENEGVLLVRTSDEAGMKTWPIPQNQAPGDVIRMPLWDAVAIVLEMQREVETGEERALRLAPGVNWRRR